MRIDRAILPPVTKHPVLRSVRLGYGCLWEPIVLPIAGWFHEITYTRRKLSDRVGDQLRKRVIGRRTRDRGRNGVVRSWERWDEKSIRDLKELSTPGNSVVGYDAKRMTGPVRLFPTQRWNGRGERGRDGWFPKRFGLARGTTPNPPAPGVSNYPLRSGRSGSGNHQPISLSARSRVVIVPGVHCAPIVIGYQRYFCLNCRTFGRSLLPMEGYVRIAELWRCRIASKRPHKFSRPIGWSKH